MKKILILSNDDVGLYKFRKELIKEFISKGYKVIIAVPKGQYIDKLIDIGCIFENINISRRGMNPLTDFLLIIRYIKILRIHKPSILLTYTIKPNIYGGILANFLKIKYAINITGLGTAFYINGLLKRIIILFYRLSCKNAKVVFFENEQNRKIFVNHKIVNIDKTYKLNGAGVNLAEFIYEEYPKNYGEIKFLFIGRIMREKGINELMSVATKIKNKYSNVFFDLIGSYEENYYSDLLNLQEQGILKFHGFQNDVQSFIKDSHCIILPSHHEGMANSLLEAGAMGRPLIASNINGCKEAIINNVSGFTFEVRDETDFFIKIDQFIQLNYEDKVQMGKKSREHIKKNFNKKNVVDLTIKELKI
jgi:galacturonosyltransferase